MTTNKIGRELEAYIIEECGNREYKWGNTPEEIEKNAKAYFDEVDKRIALHAKCTGCIVSGNCFGCNPCSNCEGK